MISELLTKILLYDLFSADHWFQLKIKIKPTFVQHERKFKYDYQSLKLPIVSNPLKNNLQTTFLSDYYNRN